MNIFYFPYRFLLTFSFLVVLLTAEILVYGTENALPLSGKIIVIDAGHGGIDPGANRPGIQEKDINLAIALQLKESLRARGAKVIVSRECDRDLSPDCDNPKVKGRYHRDLAARLELVEESDADLFISIHANTSKNSRQHGPESFYFTKSEPSKLLANCIQNELATTLHAVGQANSGDYFLLRRNTIAAVLVEVGYITNAVELSQLQTPEYQDKIVNAITSGVEHYCSTTTGVLFPFFY